ncbi:MAG: hypothetical protein D6737_20115, partial [Chloroflexi bacterium]
MEACGQRLEELIEARTPHATRRTPNDGERAPRSSGGASGAGIGRLAPPRPGTDRGCGAAVWVGHGTRRAA